ncbi:MAG: PAS domain S-box protein [Pseudomonadota bacterium]
MTIPYSEISAPINRHARNTFGLAGLIVLVFGTGGVLLFRTQKKKTELEAETKYLKEIAESAEALRASEEKYRVLFQSAAEGILVADIETMELTYANPAICRMLGYTEEQLKQMSVRDLHPKEALRDVISEFNAQARGEKTLAPNIPCLRKDGTTVYADINTVKVLINQREYNVGFFTDVSERREAERALRSERDKAQKYLDVAGVMLIAVDAGQKVTLINKKGCEILGYDEKEIIGKNWFDNFLPKEMKNDVSRVFRQLMDGEIELVEYFENPVLTKNGDERLIAWHNTLLKDGQGNIQATLSSGEDITERKLAEKEKEKMQAQFLRAQKMEAIGTMAGGIAHDFNNILTVMRGNAQLMAMDLDPTQPHHELLKEIEKQAVLGSTLTRQLLGFARGGKYEVKTINLTDVVRESSTAFGRTKKQIPIHLTLQEDLPPVEADAGQVEQVLMNLYVNAAYAMPAGGDLYLETRAIGHEEIQVRPSHMKPGSYVLLSVRDTGVGMDKETQERIFDPFFTTREMGRGTGLGLASVFGIIENHKGYIDVESEKGKGTTFKIYLPISKKEVTQPVKVAEQIIKGSETILLVDDEEQVLKLSVRILNSLGYTVLEARNGREAVDVYEREKDKIDLVILDMIMPAMGGGKAYDLLKETNPDIKVLLCSGYSIDGHAMEILEQGCDGFIQKPFDIKGLSHKIREILDLK